MILSATYPKCPTCFSLSSTFATDASLKKHETHMSDTLQLVVNIRNCASLKKHETHMSDMLQLVVNIRNCASLKNAKPHVRHLIVRF